MKKEQFISMIYLSIIFFLLISCAERPREIVNVERFREKDNWQILHNSQSKDSGLVELSSEKWIMHFLHWRPLNDENLEISVDYVRNLILNLWGPSMPFTFKEDGGKTEINGHDAYYAEGTLNNGMVRSRFYVWNCLETNRQFISDCNYNLKRETPEELFLFQCDQLTPSIKCHNNDSGFESPNENMKNFHSEDLNVSFNIPNEWETKEFVFPENMQNGSGIPGMYSTGVTDTLGSILTLMKDSEKRILLKWIKSQNDVTIDELKNEISKLEIDSTIEQIDTNTFVQKLENFSISDITENKNYIICNGTYDSVYDLIGYDYKDVTPCVYRAYMYREQKVNYFLFTSMVAYSEFWNIEFDLIPTDKEFNSYINNDIVPNIPILSAKIN